MVSYSSSKARTISRRKLTASVSSQGRGPSNSTSPSLPQYVSTLGNVSRIVALNG